MQYLFTSGATPITVEPTQAQLFYGIIRWLHTRAGPTIIILLACPKGTPRRTVYMCEKGCTTLRPKIPERHDKIKQRKDRPEWRKLKSMIINDRWTICSYFFAPLALCLLVNDLVRKAKCETSVQRNFKIETNTETRSASILIEI